MLITPALSESAIFLIVFNTQRETLGDTDKPEELTWKGWAMQCMFQKSQDNIRYFFHSYFSSLFSDFPWVEHNFLNYDFSASLPPVRNAGCVILTMGHNGQWGYFGPNKPRHPGRNVVQYPHMYTVQYRPPVYMSLYTSGQSFPGPQPGRSSEPWVRILAAPCLEMSRMKTVRESDHQIERL